MFISSMGTLPCNLTSGLYLRPVSPACLPMIGPLHIRASSNAPIMPQNLTRVPDGYEEHRGECDEVPIMPHDLTRAPDGCGLAGDRDD